jgi:hypothetical protein
MSPLRIVIDARRIRDFGIGTYIRSLVRALSEIDSRNRYTLVTGAQDIRDLAGLPENFHTAAYAGEDERHIDNVLFPMFLRGLAPDLVHLPLNRVPLLMIQPNLACRGCEGAWGWRLSMEQLLWPTWPCALRFCTALSIRSRTFRLARYC